MKRILLVFSITFVFAASASAQLRTRSIDRLDWHNLWIGNGNMAAISSNAGESELEITEAELGADFSSGELRNIYDPETSLLGRIGIESYTKLKNTCLYGCFRYGYEYDWGNTWRGTLHPYDSPFALVDAVPGNATDETYSMRAGMSRPIGKFSVGMDASYDVGIFAKLKDLRNRNTDMSFRIAPSMTYTSGLFKFGLSAGYRRSTEKVEYTQIATSNEAYLYYIYGMWLFNKYGFSSAETSRYTGSDAVYGNLAFEFGSRSGEWRSFNSFSFDLKKSEQTETKFNNLVYGDVYGCLYAAKAVLQYREAHRIVLTASYRGLSADRYLQQEEQDLASSIRRWVTYGDPIPCWFRMDADFSLKYDYRKAFVREFSCGADYSVDAQRYTTYPLKIDQRFESICPFVSYSRYITAGKFRYEISPRMSYRLVLDSIGNGVSVAGGKKVEGIEEVQLSEPMNAEIAFWGSSRMDVSVALGFEIGKVQVRGSFGLAYAPMLDTFRRTAGLKLVLSIGSKN